MGLGYFAHGSMPRITLLFAKGSKKLEMIKVDHVRSGKPTIAKMNSLKRLVCGYSITTFKSKEIFLTGGFITGILDITGR